MRSSAYLRAQAECHDAELSTSRSMSSSTNRSHQGTKARRECFLVLELLRVFEPSWLHFSPRTRSEALHMRVRDRRRAHGVTRSAARAASRALRWEKPAVPQHGHEVFVRQVEHNPERLARPVDDEGGGKPDLFEAVEPAVELHPPFRPDHDVAVRPFWFIAPNGGRRAGQ